MGGKATYKKKFDSNEIFKNYVIKNGKKQNSML